MAADLPISLADALRARKWLNDHFGPRLVAATAGTVFDADLLAAIVCQESAVYWLEFPPATPVAEVIAACVFDASGDVPGHPRTAFPRDTAAFRRRYGDGFTEMLIAEANRMRALRGLKPARMVYKGYGIFQYDLQFVATDEAFFRQRRWHDFDICLARAMGELKTKHAAKKDLWAAVKAYNGAGASAERYKVNVRTFYEHFRAHPA